MQLQSCRHTVVRLVQVKDAIREVNEIVQSANVENLLASAHLERIPA